MTIKKAIFITLLVILAHAVGLLFNLYEVLHWYDIPMHIGGGFAMGALGLGIWNEGVEDVTFRGWFENHLKWWLVPGVVLGFVAFIGVLWELHEWLMDVFLPMADTPRQPDVPDTMMDFVFDLLGGIVALLIWRKK